MKNAEGIAKAAKIVATQIQTAGAYYRSGAVT